MQTIKDISNLKKSCLKFIKSLYWFYKYSLHQNISFKRAFNPILGETYEGYFTLDEEIIKKDWNIGTGICFSPIITKPNQNIDDSFDQITDFSI